MFKGSYATDASGMERKSGIHWSPRCGSFLFPNFPQFLFLRAKNSPDFLVEIVPRVMI